MSHPDPSAVEASTTPVISVASRVVASTAASSGVAIVGAMEERSELALWSAVAQHLSLQVLVVLVFLVPGAF
jgi:hypothetical protein